MESEVFKEIIRGSRSIPRFKDTPIAVDRIRELIDCARYARSRISQGKTCHAETQGH